MKQIAFEEPRPLRRLDRRIPVDLETIVAKAMAKHLDERYQTAQRLADDLSAFLAHRPIKARPSTWRDRVLKWSRRHQAAMWSAVAALLVTVAVLSASIAMISVARKKERLALDQVGTERDAGYQSLYVAEMRLAQQDWQRGDVARMQDLLDAHRPQPGRPDLRGWEWYYLQSLPAGEELVFRSHADDCTHFGVLSTAWSPDGQCVASTAFNTRLGLSEIKIWNPETGAEIRTITSKREVNTLAWSPDSQRLAACCGTWREGRWLNVWNVATGQCDWAVQMGSPDASTVSWNPAGTRLTSAGPDHSVVIWDAATGGELRRLAGYPADVDCTAWSPDGRWIAAAGYEPGTMLIWNAETGEIRHRLSNGERHNLQSLGWNADSSRVAAGSSVGTAAVWDVATGEELFSQHHPSTVRDVAFSPDGRRLATALAGNRVTIFDAASGAIERTIQGHDAELNAIAWSPDRTRLATAARDGLVKIWNAAHDATMLRQATDVAGPVVWSTDDRFLAYGSVGKSVVLCNATTGQQRHTLAGHERLNLQGLCWNSDGSLLACPGDDGTIRVWDAATGEILHTWTHDGLPPDYKMVALTWHSNGRQLASLVDTHAEVRIWDARSGQLVEAFPFGNRSQGYDMDIAWSLDGRRLATVGIREGLKIWDAAGWRCLHQIMINQQLPSWSVAWSPDSRQLATGGTSDVPLRVFDMETGQAVSAVYGQLGMGQGTVAWGDDGRRLLTCGPDGTRVWDARSGEQLLALEGYTSAAWSHDQQRIAVVTDGRIAIHSAAAGYALANDANHLRYRARVHSLRGMEMLSAGNNQEAYAELNLALRLAPDDAMVQARAAWFFATCADAQFRDPERADEVEARAVAGMPASGFDWSTLGMIFGDLNADPHPLEKIRLGLRFAPDEPGVLQRAVWFLTNCADEQYRDPQRAVELATKAAQAWPSDLGAWQVFGWALYRTGQWQASSDALEKSVQLQGDGGDPWQWYFLAMAHARLGNRDAARQWFDKSENWNKADLDPQQKSELARFAAEAKAVLAASRSVAATE